MRSLKLKKLRIKSLESQCLWIVYDGKLLQLRMAMTFCAGCWFSWR